MCVSWLFCVKRTFIHFDDVDADDRLETCSCACLSLTQCLRLLCLALIAAGPADICFFHGIEQELEMIESTSVHGADDERFGGVDGCCTGACSGVVFGGGRVLMFSAASQQGDLRVEGVLLVDVTDHGSARPILGWTRKQRRWLRLQKVVLAEVG